MLELSSIHQMYFKVLKRLFTMFPRKKTKNLFFILNTVYLLVCNRKCHPSKFNAVSQKGTFIHSVHDPFQSYKWHYVGGLQSENTVIKLVLCKNTQMLSSSSLHLKTKQRYHRIPQLEKFQYEIMLEVGGVGDAARPVICKFPEEFDLLMWGRR